MTYKQKWGSLRHYFNFTYKFLWSNYLLVSLCTILWGQSCCSSAVHLGRITARHSFPIQEWWLLCTRWMERVVSSLLQLARCGVFCLVYLGFFVCFIFSLLREQVIGSGSSPCDGKQRCWPVQRCAGAAAWPMCFLTVPELPQSAWGGAKSLSEGMC